MNNTSKFDSIKYIDEINDIEELKKEFKDLWEDYYGLNKVFDNISLKYNKCKKILNRHLDQIIRKYEREYEREYDCIWQPIKRKEEDK